MFIRIYSFLLLMILSSSQAVAEEMTPIKCRKITAEHPLVKVRAFRKIIDQNKLDENYWLYDGKIVLVNVIQKNEKGEIKEDNICYLYKNIIGCKTESDKLMMNYFFKYKATKKEKDWYDNVVVKKEKRKFDSAGTENWEEFKGGIPKELISLFLKNYERGSLSRFAKRLNGEGAILLVHAPKDTTVYAHNSGWWQSVDEDYKNYCILDIKFDDLPLFKGTIVEK